MRQELQRDAEAKIQSARDEITTQIHYSASSGTIDVAISSDEGSSTVSLPRPRNVLTVPDCDGFSGLHARLQRLLFQEQA